MASSSYLGLVSFIASKLVPLHAYIMYDEELQQEEYYLTIRMIVSSSEKH